MHVLVVDDDLALANLVSDVLSDEGLQVETVTSVEAARTAVATQRPVLVLLDQRLPDGGGLANVRMLKEVAPQPLVVLLFTAGQLTQADLEAAGADGYIAKPFDLSALVEEVLRWLGSVEG
ncbi:MAG TPA: response regulator [Chloroflexi bacterium]|nr:response regulator [Chloroflexota bacterium]